MYDCISLYGHIKLYVVGWRDVKIGNNTRVDTQATPDFAKIDAYVNAQVQDACIPGLALGIIQGDQVANLHGFGEADSTGRAVTPHTPFLIGSLTKSFTALAIMRLVELLIQNLVISPV